MVCFAFRFGLQVGVLLGLFGFLVIRIYFCVLLWYGY